MKPDPGTNTVLHETGHTREKFQSSGKAGIPTIENLRSLKENYPIIHNELKRENPDLFKAADLHKSVGKKPKSDYGKEKIVMGADFFRRAADGFSTVVDEATANSYGKAQANKLGIRRTFDKFSEGNQSSYVGDSAASNILKTKNDLKQHIKNHKN